MYICEACGTDISIHALREEGDESDGVQNDNQNQFLSTPSARRATSTASSCGATRGISIHALREEGDAAAARLLSSVS